MNSLHYSVYICITIFTVRLDRTQLLLACKAGHQSLWRLQAGGCGRLELCVQRVLSMMFLLTNYFMQWTYALVKHIANPLVKCHLKGVMLSRSCSKPFLARRSTAIGNAGGGGFRIRVRVAWFGRFSISSCSRAQTKSFYSVAGICKSRWRSASVVMSCFWQWLSKTYFIMRWRVGNQ